MTDEHKRFLDELRESGKINMFGAGPLLRQEFGMGIKESHQILSDWMDSFED